MTPGPSLDRVRDGLAGLGRVLGELAGSGPLHRRRLAAADVRIAVSGVRGKSTATRVLHETLLRRGYDTYAKVTGDRPRSLYGDETHEIRRSEQTRLYENEREIRRFAPVDALVVENQGIREYTTRLVNESYVRPDVVVLTNVREDHLDTLGSDRREIARSLARSVPAGTRVVCGEPDPTLREYLGTELDRRDAPVTFVDVPDSAADLPGAETVYCVDAALRAVGEPPLAPLRRERLLEDLAVDWTRLPNGRVFDASNRNDVQSTEQVRRALVDDGEAVQPLIHLRPDRPGRTASFVRYFRRLANEGAIEQVREVAGHWTAFADRVPVPVVEHDPDEDPRTVIDAALSDGDPVMIVGNAVTPFVWDLQTVIERRRVERTRDREPVPLD